MTQFNKVFCIGLSRTGTTSIAAALESLGLKANALPYLMKNTSFLIESKWQVNRIAIFLSKKLLKKRHVIFRNTYSRNNRLVLDRTLVEENDALSDTPVARFYKELDRLYPNSKFILTIRNLDSWLSSCERHFQRRYTGGRFDQLNFDLYGTNIYNEKLFREAYDRHIKDVTKYFSKRCQDLLIIDICGGDGFQKICPFLGLEISDSAFPWLNSNKGYNLIDKLK